MTGFARELAYPTHAQLPSRGDGPRCEVIWEDGDGPWAIVIILVVKFHKKDQPETHRIDCLMPSCYAVPLMMINKQIAFFESLRTEDGNVRKMPHDKRLLQLRQVHLLEYTYLWKLRTKFLQAIYNAEYDAEAALQQVESDWRWKPIHGYLVREYEGWGHNVGQRAAYWAATLEAGETPYKNRKIEDFGQSYIDPYIDRLSDLMCL